MKSIRKRKKDLKKLYSKAITCGVAIPNNNRYLLRNNSLLYCTLTHMTDCYYSYNNKNTFYKDSDEEIQIYEITQFSYCPYNNEHDFWDCTDLLKNKVKNFKGKYKILKFKFKKIEI